MTDIMDAGDIVAEDYLSLRGSIKDIFARMQKTGLELTKKILKGQELKISQEESMATHYKRRLPKDSEITLDEIKTQTAEYLFNKVRMLESPYPNAFIRTADGKALKIKSVEIVENINTII